MRVPLPRLLTLVAGVAIVVSCDGAPTTTRIGSGISGGPTGTAPIVPPPPGSPDSTPPIVLVDQPLPIGTDTPQVNVGDSILVVVRLSDGQGLGSVRMVGLKETGDPNFGTFQSFQRYPLITAPASGDFRAGLTDTTIRRFLRPGAPLDTTLGIVIIQVEGEDAGGNVTIVRRPVKVVAGPKVFIETPDSLPVGRTSTITVIATHPVGVASDSVRIRSDTLVPWTTPVDQVVELTFPAGTTESEHDILVTIPADAPVRSRVHIDAYAFDAEGNPGRATPVTIFTRLAGTQAPRVFQTVPAMMERTDRFTVEADGDGIVGIGRYIIDKVTRDTLRVDTVFFPTVRANADTTLPLIDSLGLQGKRLDIISFAIDNNTPPLTGYSMPPGSTVRITNIANARIDTTVVAYGTTFASPRSGVMGDLLVDPNRGNVFLSNTSSNLLEVWDNATKTFSSNGIPVGAQPWGMFQSFTPDTLLVGNSGATTISRVFIGTSDKTQMREALSRRIRTRDITVYRVRFGRDPDTGRITLSLLTNVSYSDRPQYVVESAGGRIFYSTRPTQVAPAGTLRWLDPTLPFPDPQQITAYGTIDPELGNVYAIFHVDSVAIVKPDPNLAVSDTLVLYDHPYGQLGPTIESRDVLPPDAVTEIRGLGSDAFTILNMDMTSLELTDTTFVAASGDRQWVGFGEGNTQGGTGRIMMVNDLPATAAPGFFSPAVTVTDIVDNASEKVFGLAIDATGLQVTSHGLQTYMAALDLPFHLRLDGVYDSFDNGAGVAYHPLANSTLSLAENRVSFSATASGVIEVIDVAHYNNRGRFVTKGNLYGPLRASLPLPGDNAGLTCPGDVNCIVLKLFGLTSSGMVVIDVRASDIKPGF
jgi:hypothetical protein